MNGVKRLLKNKSGNAVLVQFSFGQSAHNDQAIQESGQFALHPIAKPVRSLTASDFHVAQNEVEFAHAEQCLGFFKISRGKNLMVQIFQHGLHSFENRRFRIDQKNLRLIYLRRQFDGFVRLCRSNFLARNFDRE